MIIMIMMIMIVKWSLIHNNFNTKCVRLMVNNALNIVIFLAVEFFPVYKYKREATMLLRPV